MIINGISCEIRFKWWALPLARLLGFLSSFVEFDESRIVRWIVDKGVRFQVYGTVDGRRMVF